MFLHHVPPRMCRNGYTCLCFVLVGPKLIAKDGYVKIIETNLRASRTFPFSSKTIGTDLIEVATRAILGEKVAPVKGNLDLDAYAKGETTGYVGVKVPMFSFKRLLGADPTLGVEMASTGEVACFGDNKHEAFLKALHSTGQFPLPKERKVLVSIQTALRADFKPSLERLHAQGYELFATEETAAFIERETDLPVTHLHWIDSGQSPNIDEYCRNSKIELVMMFANSNSQRTEKNYEIRRLATDFGIPLITNVQVAELYVSREISREAMCVCVCVLQ